MFGKDMMALLVDDSPRSLEAYGRLVRRHGFHPVTARTFENAAQLLESLNRPPEAILTDVILDGGRVGSELMALAIARFGNRSNVALMSAYSNVDLGTFGPSVIQKPGVSEIARFLIRAATIASLQYNPVLALPVTNLVEAHGLSAHEAKIVAFLAIGGLRRELAEAMGLSENTIKGHIRTLLRRFNADSVKDVVAKIQRAVHETTLSPPLGGGPR